MLWLKFRARDGRIFQSPILVANGEVLRLPSKWLLGMAEAQASSATLDAHGRALRRFTEYFYRFPPRALPDTATEEVKGSAMEHYFRGFSGTLSAGSKELEWKSLSFKHAKISGDSVAKFCDWLLGQPGFATMPHPNPLVTTLAWEGPTAILQRRERDMLFHLYRATKAGRGIKEARKNAASIPKTSLQHQLGRSQNRGTLADPKERIGYSPKAMSLEDYTKLLDSTRRVENWRNLMLWLLLGGGCARTAEALNVYAADVHYSSRDLEAYVALANPEEGLVADSSGELVMRKDYLQSRFGLTPRNRLAKSDPLFAGYKGMMLGGVVDANLPEIEFWPNRGWALTEWLFPHYGRIFLHAITNYRGQLQKKGLSSSARHPYLFMNLDENAGAPMTRQNVRDQLHIACRRAGIRERPPHALRHTYGNVCADLGIPIGETQIRMRHENPTSTLVYYQMSRKEARKLYAEAERKRFSERRLHMLSIEKEKGLLLPPSGS